jgi:DNA primase
MRVSRDGIDEIKRRSDLAEVVIEHGIELKRRGRTLFGLCPFHEERTASFAVNQGAGLFHCLGCGASGDVIGFVVRFHRISFREALERLAVRSGVQLENLMEERPSAGLPEHTRRRLNEMASARFARLAMTSGRRP